MVKHIGIIALLLISYGMMSMAFKILCILVFLSTKQHNFSEHNVYCENQEK